MKDESKILLLIRFLKKFLTDATFKADVKFPDVQRVTVENSQEIPDQITIKNTEDVKPDLGIIVDAVNSLNKAIAQEVKSVKDKIKPAEFKSLEKKLDKISKELSRTEDYSSIIKALEKLEKTTEKVDLSIDLSGIEKQLEMFNLDPLEKYTLYGEVKTRLNEKQLEKLIAAVGKEVAMTAGGERLQATYEGVPGQPVHVVGDGDKYVVSNIAEGSAIGTNDAIPMAGEDGSGNKQPILIDDVSGGQITTGFEHHELHEGNHYYVQSYQDLSINNVLQFTWQMPNTTKWTHWTWHIDTESETLWQVYEGGSITNPLANAVTPLNSNRNSSNTSGTTMRFESHANLANADGDVDISGATLISSGISGAGRESGEAKRENELILKANTLYVLRATATAAGFINFHMTWYEHTSEY